MKILLNYQNLDCDVDSPGDGPVLVAGLAGVEAGVGPGEQREVELSLPGPVKFNSIKVN